MHIHRFNPTDHFRTWDLELASCRGFDDPRVDDDRVHELLVADREAQALLPTPVTGEQFSSNPGHGALGQTP